jgi:hypothetical protein
MIAIADQQPGRIIARVHDHSMSGVELLHVVPLRGDLTVERIIDQYSERSPFRFDPSGDLLVVFSLRKLDVSLIHGRGRAFLARCRNGDRCAARGCGTLRKRHCGG